MNWRASRSQLSKCWVRARKRINCQSMKPNQRHLLWQRCRELYPPSLVRIRKRKKMIVQLSGLKLPREARSRRMTTFQKARLIFGTGMWTASTLSYERVCSRSSLKRRIQWSCVFKRPRLQSRRSTSCAIQQRLASGIHSIGMSAPWRRATQELLSSPRSSQ